MPSKTEEYLALAQRTANGLTRYWESWTDYLTTASRLYKYPFADQLMIYAQRPDATACASFDIWNNRMNRYVRRGSKGIALLDQSSSVPRLHYVFDVSDTGVRRNSRDPEVWQLGPDLVQPVSEMLAATYGISGERVSQQLADVAGKLVADYWDNNGEDIRAIVDGSLLMDYDEAGVEMQFKSAAAISVTYTLLERCGFEPAGWFDKDDFRAIHEFSTPDSVYALGAAVSDMSREVLRQIERTVKTTIRRRNNERSQHEYEQQSELHADRGLSSPEPDPASAEDPAGQVRQDAPELPEAAAPGAVPHDAPEREPVPDPEQTGADRSGNEGPDDGRTAGEEPGSGQGEEPDGVGAAHEQSAGAGRGSDSDGTDLQLSFLDAVIPTETQQIEHIDRAESEKSPSAFALSQAEIENELREHGSGVQDGKWRIIELYQTQPDRKLRAKALAKEYGIGGHSQDFLDGSSGFVNHDGKGLEFDHYPDHQKVTLSWTQVEKYIDLMIQSDRYLTDKEKEHRAAVQEAERQLPMLDGDAAAEYNALKEQYPNTLIGFELGGYFLFYDKDAITVKEVFRSNLLSQENALGKVKVTGFLRREWVAKSQKLWAEGNSIYLAGQGGDGTHHQTKYLREEDYLPIGIIIKLDGRDFRVDHVNFMFKSVSLQDMDLTNSGQPIFRVERLPNIRELYEQQQDEIIDVSPEKAVDYKVGDEVVVDLPSRTIEGKIGYVGETDVRIDTSAHGQSWDNEILNKQQFEDGLRRDEPTPDEELDKLPISVEVNGEWQTFPDAAAADEALNAEPMPEAAGNFHITDDNLGVGGPKQKFARNIEAIQTLRTLEQEHRGATAEEQQVLSQYVGWGGLADVFDPNKENWSAEYTQLKGLLTEEEYAAARASTLNAHYTSPVVIRAIYDAVEKMGFQSGNILEPSMGIGNFFGMLPSGMADSRLYGVELDSITGHIAQKLYPQADITVAGFETTDRRDFYDLAVGNVPFGQYKVNDKAYNKLGFSIHNYFFAKTIDQIRPGGVIAFVTSRFTMDSKDSSARKYMAERADLLGAIRLPNNAFKANASTEVVSDILFLQKRDRPADIEPAWVQLGQTEDGFNINQYFVDHPEMVLGNLELESTQYGHDLTVAPIEDANLADQLTEAVQHIEGQYTAVEIAAPDVADAEVQRKTLPADPTVKNFSYTVVDGEIYYRENSIMTQIELSDNAKGRVAGMVELRQIVNELIDQQLNDFPDEDIKASQAKLNYAYDAFTAKYGLINDKKNARLFDDDSSYYLLCSLENLDENKNLKSKADMFTKRTIRPERIVTSVDTPSEALAVSIGEHGKVDLPYMADLLGTPGNYERITTELSGVIFKEPAADADDPEAGWQTADEYLSGNVRDKLRMAQLAAESHPEFRVNVEALEKAQPKDLEASEIDVRLGATWLDPSIVQQFMMETFQPPYRIRYNNAITVRYSPYTSEWRMVYDDKKAAGERLLLARQEMPNADMMLLGTYRGFELNIRFDSFKNEHQAVLRAELSYPVSLGDDARGNITRLDNAIDNFADRIADAKNALQNLEQQKQAAEVEVAKPFAQEEELAEKSARLAEFRPGEITAEEANKVGYELAMRFTKGKYAFVVATHTDRQHIHNHVIFNSTALDGTRKFRDFFFSALAVQRLSDLICLEHQLSVIEKKPYRERQKRVLYPPKESNRDRLCGIIDTILAEKPGDYETFLQKLEQQGYEVKRGKYTAVKGKGQKRFIRFRTLGTGYGEDEIKAVLEGKAKHQPYQKKPPKEQPFQLLVDIQGKMAEGKSVGYKKWATKFNLKEMSKTLLFLQEQKISSTEELRERAAVATERYHTMGNSIKAAEARLTEIAVLKTHIINYAKTRPVYDAYRKSGYSKKFLEAHREEITLHKAAKTAFDEAGLQKLPKVKELDAEFAELLTRKKAAYPDYRKARNEMQELVRAQKNVERFFAGEKDTIEKAQTR